MRTMHRDPAMPTVQVNFADCGFGIAQMIVQGSSLALLSQECDRLQAIDARSRVGIRNPLSLSPLFAEIEQKLRPLATQLAGGDALPVRSILFDKTPETNWDVVWHQDVTIAVKERKDVDGFGPWSVKQGVPHVQPPVAVLEKMVTLRLHLDDCPAENGPLLVVPGSHTHGFIDVRTLDTAECDRNAVACVVNAGDVVAMRPLILHASKKSLVPSHRRVLHIEYACEPLQGGPEWA